MLLFAGSLAGIGNFRGVAAVKALGGLELRLQVAVFSDSAASQFGFGVRCRWKRSWISWTSRTAGFRVTASAGICHIFLVLLVHASTPAASTIMSRTSSWARSSVIIIVVVVIVVVAIILPFSPPGPWSSALRAEPPLPPKKKAPAVWIWAWNSRIDLGSKSTPTKHRPICSLHKEDEDCDHILHKSLRTESGRRAFTFHGCKVFLRLCFCYLEHSVVVGTPNLSLLFW